MSRSADDYLKQGGTDWDQLSKLIRGENVDPAELQAKKDEAEERRVYYEGLTYRAFSEGEGRIWLVDYLKIVTVDQPCYVLGSDDRLGWIREGQNTIYRYIRDCIRGVEQQGRGKQRKPRQIPL